MLPISLTMAGIATLINIWLSVLCGKARHAANVSMGDGGNEKVIAAMRAQSNFIEYTPLFLILLFLIENYLRDGTDASSMGPLWLWIVSGLFMVGRIAHALGMQGKFGKGRMVGMLLTMPLLLAAALYAITIPHLPQPPAVDSQTAELPNQ